MWGSGEQTDGVSQRCGLFPFPALGEGRSPWNGAASGGRSFLAVPGAGLGCAGAAPCSVRVSEPGVGGGRPVWKVREMPACIVFSFNLNGQRQWSLRKLQLFQVLREC